MTTAIPAHGYAPPDDFDPFAGPALAAAVAATAAQREVWAATWMGEDASLAFNEAVSVELRGVLDVGALTAAVRDVVARHEALRATFSHDGTVLAVAEADGALPVARHDWSALPPQEQDAAWAALRTRVVTDPFDLLRGPLVRFDLARFAPERHALVVSAHHIVCDGWSFGVLVPELAAAYSARRAGSAPELPPAESFAAYAVGQTGPDARDAADEAARYWLAQFASGVPVLDLPTDRPRESTRTYAAGRSDHVVAADVVGRVTRAGARLGASQFATLFGAFGMLLHRLGAGEDLVVGVPAAGQPACGLPRLVGHLVSMLPVRLRITAETPAAQALAHARGQVLDAYDHQALTFGDLLARLPLARDPGRPPLVSVAFNVDRGMGAAALPFAGLTAAVHSVPRCHENFDLFVNAVELDGAITLECQYNRALYDEATVRAWLAAYECLLGSLADTADAGASVDALELVPATSGAAIEGPPLALPARPLVHRLVEAQVARTPDAVAVDDGARALTYRELDSRANRLARHLRDRGVRRGTFVGLCLNRTAELLVSVLAVLKAGGAYVPLDPGHPVGRVAYMAEDAQVALLLTEEAVRADARLAEAWSAARVVSVDGADAEEIAARSDAGLDDESDVEAAGPEDPAYVIYTSGSTGRPKGVVVPHRSVVNLLLSVRETPGMAADDVVLAITTLSFDIAVSETLLPLTVGARVVLASREVATDGLQLRARIERAGVTFIDATPATYRMLLAAGWEGGPHLRVVCTGEAMPRDVGEALLAHAGEVWNGYGPTETTVWSSFWRVRAPLTRVLIGSPIANTRAYVLDARGRPVPVGVRGELFIGGAGVTTGYLRRPELTAERFVADPFAGGAGARMYRTGDVARVLADGQLECLGRTDHQVKVRGYRIELGEIEGQLGTCPGVGACAVVVREDRAGDPRLVAYAVARGNVPNEEAVRAHLGTSLPDYMVPPTYVWLPVLPLTPSGKIDRAALPAPQAGAGVEAAGAAFVAPRTAAERLVAELWAEALRVSRLGAHDDFFRLGGHSLLAAQVLGRLRRDHGVELPYRRIFEAPTVEKFAAVVAAAVGGEESAAVAPAAVREIPHDPARTSAPLTVLQQRLWRLEELDPATVATHVHSAAWRLVGALDAGAVQGAIDDFVRRHDQMRTRFELAESGPVQVVEPDARILVSHVDLTGLDPVERANAVAAYMDEQGDAPFDLGAAPLMRVALVALAPDEHLLHTVRHGIVWDGWSFDIFITEFCELLEARATGRLAALPPIAITLGDFAEWQRAHLTSPEMERQVAWWRAHLGDDLPTLELPTDRPRPAQPTYRGDHVQLAFSRGEVDALTTLARAHGATLFVLLLSAYNVLLHRYSGQRDLVVATPVRARTRPETEPVVGAFVNTVLLRSHVEPNAPFIDLLGAVRDVTLDAFGHQEMPFELLGGKLPAVRALFSMQDARARPIAAAGLRVEQVHVPQRTATNDLTLWTMSTDAGMRSVLNYSTDLFDRATAVRFLGHLRTLLLSLLDDAKLPISQLPLLTAGEREAALGGSVAGGPDGGYAAAAPSLLAAIVAAGAARPDAPAVRDGTRAVTSYGELLRRAGAVRRALLASGCGPGARVAVIADDLAWRAAAVLGTHAARGAVLLLDGRDPAAYSRAVATAGGVTAAIMTSAAAAMLALDVPSVALESLLSAASALADGELVSAPHDVAFLLHDVDAAGRPAAAAVPHATVDVVAADVIARLGVDEMAVAVPLHSPASPSAIYELLIPLAAGATLEIAPDGADGVELAEFLRAAGATLVAAPGAVWRELDAAGWAGGARLRALVTDGATPTLLGAVAARVGQVLAIYGHPAAGGWSAAAVPNEAAAAAVAYDVGLGGARSFVLDEGGEVAVPGAAGWLHFGGPAIDAAARVGGPASRFVADPLVDGARAYRTGVRARHAVDGRVTVLAPEAGRVSRQGRMVGFEAIAGALRGHPGLADAAVTTRTDDSGDERLVACVVVAPGARYTETELRRRVRDVLPEVAVPHHFVEVGAVARDAHGSPRWDVMVVAAPWAVARPAAPPATPSERYVAAVWLEMLGVPNVRNTDKFFDLGGHSLLCFRFIDRLARERGVRVSPRVVLLGTLEQVAAALDAGAGVASRTDAEDGDAAGDRPGVVAGPGAPGGVFGRIRRLLGSA